MGQYLMDDWSTIGRLRTKGSWFIVHSVIGCICWALGKGREHREGGVKEGRAESESWVVEVAGSGPPECSWFGWGVLGESSKLPTEMPESVLWLRPLVAHASSSSSASSSSCSHWSSSSSRGNDRHSHGCKDWNKVLFRMDFFIHFFFFFTNTKFHL